MKKSHVFWITRTAVLLALLFGLQTVTAPLPGTLITGAIVNMMLVIAVMSSGLSTGLAIAIISPFFAALVGLGVAIWPILPIISISNVALVTIWHYGEKLVPINKMARRIISGVIAAMCKFAIIYLGVKELILPIIFGGAENIPPPLAAAFSITQLFTALIGGGIAILALPIIEKAISAGSQDKKQPLNTFCESQKAVRLQN